MKKLIALSVLAFSAFASADHSIRTPRLISPTLSVNNADAIQGYLTSLIEEKEAVTVAQGLQIYDVDASERLCSVRGNDLNCQLSYLNDRWNGQINATFELSANGSQMISLKDVSFDGSF